MCWLSLICLLSGWTGPGQRERTWQRKRTRARWTKEMIIRPYSCFSSSHCLYRIFFFFSTCPHRKRFVNFSVRLVVSFFILYIKILDKRINLTLTLLLSSSFTVSLTLFSKPCWKKCLCTEMQICPIYNGPMACFYQNRLGQLYNIHSEHPVMMQKPISSLRWRLTSDPRRYLLCLSQSPVNPAFCRRFKWASDSELQLQFTETVWASLLHPLTLNVLDRTLHSQSGPHLVFKADVLSSLDLHPAVVPAVVLQGGAVDAQRKVVLPRVALQPIALVLLRTRHAVRGPGPAGAAVKDGGALAVAQTPQDLQRGMLGVLRVAEGAGQHHRVAVDASNLRLHMHGPAVIPGAAESCREKKTEEVQRHKMSQRPEEESSNSTKLLFIYLLLLLFIIIIIIYYLLL